MLRIFIIYLLFNMSLYATEEMAKKTKSTCITCHKTAKGGRPGNSMLSPRGINYLKNLIQSEIYVPAYNYPELQTLAAKIAENKRIAEGGEPLVKPAEEAKEEANEETNEDAKEAVSEDTKAEVELEAKEEVQEEPLKTSLEKKEAPANLVKKPESKEKTDPITKPKPPTQTSFGTKTTLVPSTSVSQPEPEVKEAKKSQTKSLKSFSDGTFILPRIKQIQYYNWRDDWQYDDYF